MRFVLAAAALLAVSAACGGSDFSSGNDGDSGPPADGAVPPGDGSSADGGCLGAPPICPGICGVPGGPATCSNGAWICPLVAGVCVGDASLPPPDGGHVEAGPRPDGAVVDASSPADGGLSCGTLTCDPSTEYCQVDNYPHGLDGGPSTTYACNPIPGTCQVNPTCQCIQPTGGCTCSVTGAGFTVTCDFP